MKSIAFFHVNGIAPEYGGISRVTSTLTFLFRNHDIQVWHIGAKRIVETNYDPSQIFLPNPSLESKENLIFISNFIKEHEITTIINQGALSDNANSFLEQAKKLTNFKLISCVHNSILTPIMNYAYQKEYDLKNRSLSFIFYLLNTRLFKWICLKTYSIKYKPLFKHIYEISDCVVGLSDSMENEYKQILGQKILPKYVTIPNLIDKDTHKSIKVKRDKTILWVGSVNIPTKRIDYMLQAWANTFTKHPDWQLKVLGNGPHLATAKKLAKNLKLSRVSFEGRVRSEDYYPTSEILCVTSTHEAFPMVILEALKYGVTPLVNNSFSTASELLGAGKYGVLAKPFNIKDFSAKLDELMTDKNLRETFRSLSQESIMKYSPEKIYSLWQSII